MSNIDPSCTCTSTEPEPALTCAQIARATVAPSLPCWRPRVWLPFSFNCRRATGCISTTTHDGAEEGTVLLPRDHLRTGREGSPALVRGSNEASR